MFKVEEIKKSFKDKEVVTIHFIYQRERKGGFHIEL